MTDHVSRRQAVRALAVLAAGVPLRAALGQGRCMRTFGIPACDTMPIPRVFDPTGWRTVALDDITMRVADYPKEVAFYAALMGWTLRLDDGTRAVMDMGPLGAMVLQAAPELATAAAAVPARDTSAGGGRGGRGSRAPARAIVDSFGFVIEPWNARTIEAALRARGLAPVAVAGRSGYESFEIKDPDGFAVRLSNRRRLDGSASLASLAPLPAPLPFAPTGWKTVWLDHLSFSVTNYKESASFYSNLLGWRPTYDEGSQNELLIGDVGDIIIRGGNPLSPTFGRGGRGGAAAAPARQARVDHISFGISPWDTDGVKTALEQRGLRAQIDTSTGDEIHVAAFKSYHTSTPNGYNLQISAVTRDTRLTLSNAVRPKPPGG
jgi:catechol 2,3-dioxygenase-like lactoylglutathione lyase family enzyme